MTEARRVDFWFDPSCPLTRLTARWIVEVAAVRPMDVHWRVMSLSVLNEGRADDPEGDPDGYLWVPVRICAAVAQRYGQKALGEFYTALWTTPGQAGENDWLGDFRTAMAACGLPPELADAGHTNEFDDAVRESHAEGVAMVGPDVGTPIIATVGSDGEPVAFFGPVFTEVSSGEVAGKLWDATLLLAGTAGFRELKANRG